MDLRGKSKKELIIELEELQKKYDSLKDQYDLDITHPNLTEEVIYNNEDSHFRKVVEQAPIAMAIVSSKGVIEFINHKAIEIFGYLPEDIPNMDKWWIQAYPDEGYRNKVISEWMGRVHKAFVEGTEISGGEFHVTCKDGTVKIIFISGTPVSNKVFVLFDDITQRKQVEEALRESEERYRRLVETTNTGYVIIDSKGIVLDANLEYARLTGHEKIDEIVGRNVLEWTAEEEKESNLRAVEACSRDGFIRNFEVTYVDKTGKRTPILINASVMKTEGGQKTLTLCRDITELKQMEEVLRESEEKYRLIFEYSPLGFFAFNDKGVITACNNNFVQIIGSSHKRLIGLNMLNLPDKNIVSSVQKALKGGTGFYQDEYHSVTAEKTTPVRVFFAPIDIGGYIRGGVGIVEDITERKKAEDELKNSKEVLELIFKISPDAAVITRLSDGMIVKVNERFITMSGYALNELIGKTSIELNLYENNESRDKIVEEVIKNGYCENAETIFRPKSGKTFTGIMSSQIVMLDGFQHIYSIIRDISERKHAEEALRESESNLTRAEKAAKIGHWKLMLDSKQIISSVGARIIYGVDQVILSLEEVQNKALPEYRELLNKALTDLITKDIPYSVEFKIYRAIDNKIIDIHSIADYDRKNNVVFGVVLDITERNKANQELINAKAKAEESDRLKTAFLQNMSHEIRTPMNAIVGFSDLLFLNFENKVKLLEFASIIKQSSSDLLELINDILDLSKIESGQLPINFEECNLDELLNELYLFFINHREKINKKHVEFNFIRDSDNKQINILIDKGKLKQIFINLVYNAFKFTQKGSINFGYTFNEKNELVFFVSDTGIGIPEDKQSFVFERFAQLNSSITGVKGGTGLGLSIVKGLVELLGGEITLKSVLNEGTTFTFSIPYKIAESTENMAETTSIQTNINWQAYTVLIVEDDMFSALFLKELLFDTGINILTAVNAEQCIEMVETNHNINLILMDIRIPGMNGFEATTIIKSKKPKIKIIAQTAYATTGDRQQAFSSGCDDYISKPINKDLLITKLSEQLFK